MEYITAKEAAAKWNILIAEYRYFVRRCVLKELLVWVNLEHINIH